MKAQLRSARLMATTPQPLPPGSRAVGEIRQGTARASTSAAQGRRQAEVVVICCGWNATKTLLRELLCSQSIDFVPDLEGRSEDRCILRPQGSGTEKCLDPVLAVLYQTNFQGFWMVRGGELMVVAVVVPNQRYPRPCSRCF